MYFICDLRKFKIIYNLTDQCAHYVGKLDCFDESRESQLLAMFRL